MRIKSDAIGEDLAQPVTGAVSEIREQQVGRAIAIAEKGKIDGCVGEFRIRTKDAEVAERCVVQYDEAREMQCIERAERHQWVTGVRRAGAMIHRQEQLAQV